MIRTRVGYDETANPSKEIEMSAKERIPVKKRFVLVKDGEGNEFVCPVKALKSPGELTEEEKAACVDAVAPRGLVSFPYAGE